MEHHKPRNEHHLAQVARRELRTALPRHYHSLCILSFTSRRKEWDWSARTVCLDEPFVGGVFSAMIKLEELRVSFAHTIKGEGSIVSLVKLPMLSLRFIRSNKLFFDPQGRAFTHLLSLPLNRSLKRIRIDPICVSPPGSNSTTQFPLHSEAKHGVKLVVENICKTSGSVMPPQGDLLCVFWIRDHQLVLRKEDGGNCYLDILPENKEAWGDTCLCEEWVTGGY